MIWANLLFLVGILCLVAGGVGLLLLLIPQTRIAGLVITLLFGAVGLVALALGLGQAFLIERARTSAEAARERATTLQGRVVEVDAETIARKRQQEGYAPPGMRYITGAPAGARVATPDVPVFTDERLTAPAACRYRHSALVTVVRESTTPPLAIEVKTGECAGWVGRMHLAPRRPTAPVKAER